MTTPAKFPTQGEMLEEICERWRRLEDADQRAVFAYVRSADKRSVPRPTDDWKKSGPIKIQ